MATVDGARSAIQDFVARVAIEGSPEFVPPEERIATFDNDGTLWCEKPMPIELGFILQRLAAMADQDPRLRDRQPCASRQACCCSTACAATCKSAFGCCCRW